ncbi:hypothetical protein AB0C21_09420 [Spirillospora sp. NPDC049024]
MAYQLTFFGKATEQETAAAAMDHVLDAMLESGPPLLGESLGPPPLQLGEWSGPETEAVRSFKLATATEDMKPAADYLLLEIHVGMRSIADTVIAADPDNDHGVWGSDLLALLTLSGDRPDWPLVQRIWTTLEDLWRVVPWDEVSGFGIAAKTQLPLQGTPDLTPRACPDPHPSSGPSPQGPRSQ